MTNRRAAQAVLAAPATAPGDAAFPPNAHAAKQAALDAMTAALGAKAQQHVQAALAALGADITGVLLAWAAAAVTARLRRDRVQRAHGGGIPHHLLFRQMYEESSSTYTYLLADAVTGDALLIDPVLETVERDAEVIQQLGVRLNVMLNTHMHADHITGTYALRTQHFGNARSAISGLSGARADVFLRDGDIISFGNRFVEARSTPGHTNGCLTFVLDDRSMVFTGDALLIRGCGRTDFQLGDAAKLYRSIHERILSLPDRTLVYPAHDYKGRTASSVHEERRFSPRVTQSPEAFVVLMANLNLPRPKKMEASVPRNMYCGADVAEAQAAEAKR